MIKHGVRMMAVGLLLIGPRIAQAGEAAAAPATGSVLVVTVKRDARGNHRIREMVVKNGRAPSDRRQRGGLASATAAPRQYRLRLVDKSGGVLSSVPFGYPEMRTIPMPLPGGLGDDIPPVILLEQPEVTLVIPHVSAASAAEISDASGESTLDSRSLRDAVSESGGADGPAGLESSPVPPAGAGFNLLIMASGYGSAAMMSFQSQAAAIKARILGAEPFSSVAAGITVNVHENTASLGCATGCGGIDRLICCNSSLVLSAAAASGYGYDEIIVVHNAANYAGGGYREELDAYKTNSSSTYCVVYDGPYSAAMALHEFGHSFGNLCDEYTYGSEGYSYSPCVNCRSTCSDWAAYTSSCQLSCDAKASYYRPDNSIMLDLGSSGFNAASLKAEYSPDGLEKRLEYFADQPSAPTAVSLSSGVVAEGQLAGTVVGTLTASDPDAGDTFTYSLVAGAGDTDNGSFAIAADQLQTAAVFDFTVQSHFSIRIRATDQGGLWTEREFTLGLPFYVLWTRGDAGRAALWQIDPASGARVGSVWLRSELGVGAPWQATSYEHVGDTEGYVLWTRSDVGRAALWKVDPGTGAVTGSAYLHSKTGIGAPWQATSYTRVSATEGYVLWTRSDVGRAALWKVDPSGIGTLEVLPIEASAYLHSATGVGAPWQATSYVRVSGSEGHVLWTRSDLGKAALWKIDPSGIGTLQVLPIEGSAYLYSAAGVGSPWEATSLGQVSAAEGYVLWTRGDLGKAALWKIDPSGVGTLAVVPIRNSLYVQPPSGVGSPWRATGLALVP